MERSVSSYQPTDPKSPYRPRPTARTDNGTQFNAWANITVSLWTVLLLMLFAAPAAALGMLGAWVVWKVLRPTWLMIAILSVEFVGSVVFFSPHVLWFWPWGLLLPDRLFQVFPPSTALPFGPAVEESMEIELLLGPALLLVLESVLVISERTLTAGIFRQAREQSGDTGTAAKARDLLARYASIVAPVPSIQLPDLRHPAGGIRLGADRDNRRRPFDLAVSELRLHTFMPGATGSGKTTTLERIADGATGAGYGLVIIDCKGGSLGAAARKLAAAHGLSFTLVDAGDPATTGYNPATGSPSDIANKLIGSFTFGEAGQIYQQIGMTAIPLIVRGLVAVGSPITLKTIADACEENALRLLARKVEGGGDGGDGSDAARTALADEIDGLLANADTTAKNGINSLRYRLGALLQGSFAPLFEAGRAALDWDAAVTAQSVVYVSLPVTAASEDVDLMGRVILQDLKQVCHRRLVAVGQGRTVPPVLVAIDEFAGLGEARQIVDLLLQARQAEMPLLLSTQKIPDDPALSNACLQAGLLIIHRLAAKESEDAAAQFGTRKTWKVTQQIDWESGTSQKGSVRDVEEYVVHPNTLRSLKTGEVAVRSVPTSRHAIVLVIRTP